MRFRALVMSIILCLSAIPGQGGADTLEIREWLVPWENSRPRDPYVDSRGRVWFVGQRGDYVANLKPETGEFNRYDLDPRTGPHNLIVDADRKIWYAGNRTAHIGQLNPSTGRILKIEMPDRKAKDPHTLVFDPDGDIWFTVQQGNFVGHLAVTTGEVRLIRVPTRKARPYGISVGADGVPWVGAFGSNKLIRIDPDSMGLSEIELPDEDSRPRRLVITSDGNVWYADYELGRLGRYEPANGRFTEWTMPSGENSRPYGMAVDKNDRIWVVETGVEPNRFVGFDAATGTFLTETDIPSGAGSVRHMFYYEPAGEVWFGTDTNYVGRAKVH